MIRDPSDGSVKEKPAIGIPITEQVQHVLDTSTSGLPISRAKAEYLARLEQSRQWLKSYHQKPEDISP